MKTIAIAGKGGGGKTTTTYNLAVVAHRAGLKIGLVDADPQSTLRDWRYARGTADIPMQTCSADRLKEVLALAERARLGELFIDMSPEIGTHALAIIGVADFVLLPMQPSILDLGATRQWISLLRSAAKPFGLVINAAPARREGTDAPAVRDARATLHDIGVPLWPGQVTRRAIIPHVAIGGRGVAECYPDGPAAHEYRALWRAIERALNPDRRTTNVITSKNDA